MENAKKKSVTREEVVAERAKNATQLVTPCGAPPRMALLKGSRALSSGLVKIQQGAFHSFAGSPRRRKTTEIIRNRGNPEISPETKTTRPLFFWHGEVTSTPELGRTRFLKNVVFPFSG